MHKLICLLCVALGSQVTALPVNVPIEPVEGIGTAQGIFLFKDACYNRFPDISTLRKAMSGPELKAWNFRKAPSDRSEPEERWISSKAVVTLSKSAKRSGNRIDPECSVTVRLFGIRSHVELVSALFYLIEPKPTQIAWTEDEGPSAWKLSGPKGDQKIALTTTKTSDGMVCNIKLTNLPTRAN